MRWGGALLPLPRQVTDVVRFNNVASRNEKDQTHNGEQRNKCIVLGRFVKVHV